MEESDRLMELAERFLNDDGQEAVEDFLAIGEIRLARVYLLGALDKMLETGRVSDKELSEAYSELGLDPSEIADIRNHLEKY